MIYEKINERGTGLQCWFIKGSCDRTKKYLAAEPYGMFQAIICVRCHAIIFIKCPHCENTF